MSKKRPIRINLYLDQDLSNKIKASAKRDFLRPTTWVTQFLRKNLLDNSISNPQDNEN